MIENNRNVLSREDFAYNTRGVIKTPGKFEGCMRYSPYFWDFYLNGDGEETEHGELKFAIGPEDIAHFPELKDAKYVYLWEDDNGFIHDEVTTK